MPPDAAARSAVIAETMLPAAPVTQKTVSVPSARSGSGSAGRSTSPTAQRRSSAWPTSTTPGSRRVSSIRMSASAAVLRLGGKSTALTRASERSRASALTKPVTAPPIAEVAPASS